MSLPFLAVDWGTTNCRAWRVEAGGAVEARREFPLGVARLAPGEAARRFHDEVRPAMQAEGLPALLCGMIGSTLGWRPFPYLDTPVDLPALARNLHRVDSEGPPVAIVPGLRCAGLEGAPDVMRGEETPALGWIALDPDRARGRRIVHHPGTHAKWILLNDGRLERFVTAMSGELFDVLSHHSVLRSAPTDPDDPDAFDLGLDTAADGGALAARLFSARARVVGDGLPARSARPYLSGLIIGAEVAALPDLLGAGQERPVAIVGDRRLCRLYHRAFERHGLAAEVHDGDEATLAGLIAIMREAWP